MLFNDGLEYEDLSNKLEVGQRFYSSLPSCKPYIGNPDVYVRLMREKHEKVYKFVNGEFN